MRGRTSERRWTVAAVAAALALAAAGPAAAWEVEPGADDESLRAFHRRFAAAAYPYPRHGASPLGIVGFDVYVDLAVDEGFDGEPFFAEAVSGDLPADVLAVGRVGVRKGLPGGIDLGASYGRAIDSDLELVSAELGWAILDGGLVAPALGLRLTGTRSLGDGVYELEQYGAELILSKGFAVVTPYVGGGMIWSEGRFDRSGVIRIPEEPVRSLTDDHTRAIAYAGITVSLLIPKITLEVERAEDLQAAVKVGFGF